MEINDYPKHWQRKDLKNLFKKISSNGLKIKQKDYLPEGLHPVIDQGQELIGGYYNDDKLLIPSEPPYIIFGDHTKVKKYINFKFIAGADGVKVLKPHDFIEPKFLYYSLFTINIPDKGYARHFQFLEQKEIFIPLKDEQQAIVTKLEELFSELEKGKEQLEKAQQQLKVYRQAVLKWAFEGKLTNKDVKEGELPEGWDYSDLGNFIRKIQAGKSFKCEERPPKANEVGVIKVSSVTWGEFDEEESKTILTNDRFNPNFLIREGDFLFSRANTIELVGACVLVKRITKQLMLSDKVLRFLFKDDLLNTYVLYFLKSKRGREEIEFHSTGNQDSMRNIGQNRIGQIRIPICQIKEQSKVVQEIESRLSVCDKLEETINNSLKQVETLRQSILKQAFGGKLVTYQPKEVYKPKNTYFYQMQYLGAIAKISEQMGIKQGEMTLAKFAFSVEKLYDVPSFYSFKRWHLGPYSGEMKKALNNKQFFDLSKGIKIQDEDKLFKYYNPYKNQIEEATKELCGIFLKFPDKDRAHKIELFATVCKVVEDIQTIDFDKVYASMKDWEILLKNSPFKNKAEKFSEKEVKETLLFMEKRGWVDKLIKRQNK